MGFHIDNNGLYRVGWPGKFVPSRCSINSCVPRREKRIDNLNARPNVGLSLHAAADADGHLFPSAAFHNAMAPRLLSRTCSIPWRPQKTRKPYVFCFISMCGSAPSGTLREGGGGKVINLPHRRARR